MALTSIVFLLGYFTALGMSFVRGPIWGLYTYVAVFYLHPPSRWWGASLLDLRWALLAAVVTWLSLLRLKPDPARQRWGSHFLFKVATFYVLWMVVQLIWANPFHVEGVLLYVKYLVLSFLMYRIILTEKDFLRFSAIHVAGCVFFGYLAWRSGAGGRLEGVGGPGVDDANTLGMHLSTGLIAAGALFLVVKGKWRWAVLVAGALIGNGIVQTVSRGAFLGLACGSLAFIYLAPKTYRKFVYPLSVIAVCSAVALAPARYWERLASVVTAVEDVQAVDHSASSRVEVAKAQWQMFLDHPLGLGFRTTAWLSRSYLGVEHLTSNVGPVETFGARSSHNTLLAVLCDQGFPGILMVFLLMAWATRCLFRLKAMDADGLSPSLGLWRAAVGGMLAAIISAGMFTNYFKAEVQIWALVLLAVLNEMARIEIAARAPEVQPEVRRTRRANRVPTSVASRYAARGGRRVRR